MTSRISAGCWASRRAPPNADAQRGLADMRIVGVETLRLGEFPNLLWVEIHTDAGISGLGETFFGAEAVEAWVHETAAARLLGRHALDIERHAAALTGYLSYQGAGAEARGR